MFSIIFFAFSHVLGVLTLSAITKNRLCVSGLLKRSYKSFSGGTHSVFPPSIHMVVCRCGAPLLVTKTLSSYVLMPSVPSGIDLLFEK